jgi:hypothetical protein
VNVGDTDWYTLKELAEKYKENGVTLVSDRRIEVTAAISYGEKIWEFYKKNVFPNLDTNKGIQLRDDNPDVAKQQKFNCWSTLGTGKNIGSESVFALGENGILNAGTSTLMEYQKTLLTSSTCVLGANWGDMAYQLYIRNVEDWSKWGWTVLVDGKEQDPSATNGVLTVNYNATVTWQCRNTDSEIQNISRWSFTYLADGATTRSKVRLTETVADGKLNYSFAMPAADLYAIYANKTETSGNSGSTGGGTGEGGGTGGETGGGTGEGGDTGDHTGGDDALLAEYGQLYVNIADSPIVFEKGHKLSSSGRSVDGFWYDKDITSMTYLDTDTTKKQGGERVQHFYAWDFSQDFYVTSKNEATQNQLVLVGAVTVHLKDCAMVARNAYSESFVGESFIYDTAQNLSYKRIIESSTLANLYKLDYSSYPNILLDYANGVYTSKIIIEEGNEETVIASIMENNFVANSYASIEISGSGELALGSIFQIGTCILTNVQIEEYKNTKYDVSFPDKCDYVFCPFNQSNCGLHLGKIQMNVPDKKIRCGSFYVNNSSIDFGRLIFAELMGVTGASYIRVRGDVRLNYGSFSLGDTSSMVVDGNFLGGTHAGGTYPANLTSSGYLIVKGSYLEIGNPVISNTTVICNALIPNYDLTVSGGRIIANVISNNFWRTYTQDSNSVIRRIITHFLEDCIFKQARSISMEIIMLWKETYGIFHIKLLMIMGRLAMCFVRFWTIRGI